MKTCNIRNIEYEEGSFSDIIHKYIDASNNEELDIIKKEILEKRLYELQYWSEGILSEFIPHFKNKLEHIDVNSDNWKFEINKWHWMGNILGRLYVYKWSEEVYRALYGLLCELQLSKGRIHKGLPLHQIGWVDLLRGTPESIKRSIYYMKLAMIEDIITFKTQFKNYAAYNVLTRENNLSEIYLERLAKWVGDYPETNLRPELIYLRYVLEWNNQDRSNFYDMDSKLAEQLMKEAKTATINKEKGEKLEILMAYLFLTSPGFEAVRNINTFDEQIDLLIRNLHRDPILYEFGKYILIECRNRKDEVDAKAIRDFATKVMQASCNSGILVSKMGITGGDEKQVARDARMTILKFHQRNGIIVVPLTISQLEPVIEKKVPFLNILISEYEKIRFDITY